MSGPFRPDELTEPGTSMGFPADESDLLATARELESLAAGADLRPSDGFTDRVWAAISAEPLPRPTGVLAPAARQGRLAALVIALRDTWRVAWTGGRPLAARAPAMALVLFLVVAIGSVGGLAAAGAFGLLGPSSPSIAPVGSPKPFVTLPPPSASPMPAAPSRPVPAASHEPGGNGNPTETETPKPTEPPNPTEAPKPTETARPTRTPRPTETPEPTDTPEPSDDHGGGYGNG